MAARAVFASVSINLFSPDLFVPFFPEGPALELLDE
jgi:hypothetical protein